MATDIGTTRQLQANIAFNESTPIMGQQSMITGLNFLPQRATLRPVFSLFTTLNPLPNSTSTLESSG